MAPPSRRARSGGRGVLLPLPLDAVYEILLRLTARELCRLRAVSRPWRALLSDPQFIAAHAARHPGPLIVAGYGLSSGYPDGNILCEIMDLSGRVVKRIRAAGDRTGNDSVLLTQLGFVQIVRGMSSYRLLDPATGAVYALPDELADEHAAHQADIYEYRAGVVFGKVASTGEYKALRVFDNTFDEPSSEQLCEVFTLFDGSSSHARWRAKRAPPYHVDVRLNYVAVVSGIVYFFFSEGYWYPYVKQKLIASFDLEAEEWRETLQGPLFRFEGSAPGLPSSDTNFNRVSLASLNDCLAVVHCTYSSYIDIWFLVDFEKGLWVRQHSIQLKPNAPDDGFLLYPLLVLNDGRIVTYAAKRGLLSVYNPRTTDYTDLAVTRPYVAMDLYTGNLLSLPNGASR